MKCNTCARESVAVSLCCLSCPTGYHTAECNIRTFPTIPSAQYFDDPEASTKLMLRLQKALSLAHILKNELNEIGNIAQQFIPNYRTDTLEALVAHLQIDISYAETAARKLLGS